MARRFFPNPDEWNVDPNSMYTGMVGELQLQQQWQQQRQDSQEQQQQQQQPPNSMFSPQQDMHGNSMYLPRFDDFFIISLPRVQKKFKTVLCHNFKCSNSYWSCDLHACGFQ